MVLGSSPAQFFGAAGAAASGGGDAYVVTKSLRFSSPDTAYLDRTVSIYSNQQQWTWSGWVKRAKLGTEQVIFTAGASTAGTRWSALRFQTDDSLSFINNGGGSTDINLVTSRLFRDPSAWYHIVVRANIQDEVSGNRISIYVNGEKETDFSVNTQPSASTSTGINYNQIHNIGREAARSTYYCDLYLAEVNFVDGLALTADNFGRTNSTTGSWEPIDFSSAPNNGTTWSDYLTTDDGSFDASYPKTNAFNGDQTTRAICNTAVGSTSYIQFNSPTPLSGTLRVRCDNNNEVYDVSEGSSTLLGQNTSGSDNSFVDCGEVTGLTSLKILMVSGSRAGVSAIEVGGVILIDDFNKFTNGTFYSNNVTTNGGTSWFGGSAPQAFDGSSSTYVQGALGGDVTFTPSTPIPVTSTLKIYADSGSGSGVGVGPYQIIYNGTEVYNSSMWTSPYTITEAAGTDLTSLVIDQSGSGEAMRLFYIEVDGTILTDATVGQNSFSLKFADNSSSSALGTDSSGNGNNWNVNNISSGPATTIYSNYFTVAAGGPIFSGETVQNAFDGSTSTRVSLQSAVPEKTFSFAPTTPISISSSLRIYMSGSSGAYCELDGDTITQGAGWRTMPNAAGKSISTSTPLTMGNSSYDVAVYAIEVDGVILVEVPGSDIDSLFDSPTNGTQTDTGAGGEVSGNYATLNPLSKGSSQTLANGNLDLSTGSTSDNNVPSTIGMESGKWYFEVSVTNIGDTGGGEYAIGLGRNVDHNNVIGQNSTSWGYKSSGDVRTNGSNSAYGASYTTGDVLGAAFDADAGTLTFYKNGTSQGTAATGISAGTYFFLVGTYNSSGTRSANFGQRPFAYTAPTGYQPLTTALLDDPTIADGSTAMDMALYTGTNSAQTISGLGFEPDLVWFKTRTNSNAHCLADSVRGASQLVALGGTAGTAAETTSTSTQDCTGFTSDGFSVGIVNQRNSTNQGGVGIVAWTWGGGSDYTDSTYNQSETWSTSLTAADGFYTPDNETADKAFDGRTTTYAAASITGTNNNTPLVFSKTITGITSMRIMFKGRLHLNGGSELASESGNGVWYTVSSPPSTLTQVDVYPYTQASIGPRLYAIEINGKILVDTGVNIEGSITSTVRANASAGFSIVTYTGNGTNPGASIGHGLNVTPSLIFTKSRSATGEWPSYHSALPVSNTVYLNDTYASSTYLNRFSSVSSTTFTTGSNGGELNTTGVDYVAYCFAPVEGYSAFGSYTGNGSTDGPFVYTGFRPAWLLLKKTSSAFDSTWSLFDSAREPYNDGNRTVLFPNTTGQEVTDAYPVDLLSNGFKLKNLGAATNASSQTYIYAAFAENPFKTARAR